MQWERERALWEANIRVEELDSDDTDTQGVGLGDNGQRRFASDPLKFTGIDMGPSARSRRSYGFEGDDSSSESFDSDEGSSALQIQLRDKEEALVQSALARIRRAREKGKTEVKLNQDELDALERRRKRLEAAARKEKKGSGSGSEKKRRSEKNLVTVPIASLEPSSRKKSAKHKRSGDLQQAVGPSNPPGPPGMLIPGPDGLMYAPIGYSVSSGSNRNSPTRPRSASSQQILSHSPSFYATGSHRNLSDGMRPTSSSSTSSRRPLPDEAEWIPGSSRRSSVSSQNFAVDPFEYQTSSGRPPAIPEQYLPGRRNVSNPSDIQYSSIRRSPPGLGAYPATGRAPASDPALRHRSSYADEIADSSTDESDDLGNGVQVFVDERETERERERERALSRKPVASSGRKKGKGR
ncbi:hypothetical protein GLAREA_00231 [Glarea lozoyensis ATCC 20868]|uniref:Prenylated Rab acceptor 1 n=1 Tax=Glarea lozoyensis (strain ATCC 20868 / MF5171) TaxID=1116229 RepID=S3DRG9_GLAL2|nr:uncharacterized protein GLAREA_00231 [Glarea lozoyensis ATCC 20868]EPE29073.1 hypothetical protein GLAREA_00231 [Glarea lozoyensis ATCC 20868]